MITSSDQAVQRARQHTKPCHDCPWRTKSIPGWLGGWTPERWLQLTQSDTREPCHVIDNQQCAGLAIFRANICKNPRDPEVLRLPADRVNVLAGWTEFLAHHGAKVVSKVQKVLKAGRKSGKVKS